MRDADRTRELFRDVDGLWFGEDNEITPIANEIISIEVTDSLTSSQGTSIVLTTLAAVIVLIIFFWATEFRPMLAVLAVFPILLVLIWVPGTMVLFGYSYNVITALITALSIGIGVDYTIHITHRFLEEREHGTGTIAAAIGTTRPVAMWPREIPISGEPADMHAEISQNYEWFQAIPITFPARQAGCHLRPQERCGDPRPGSKPGRGVHW